MTDKTAEKQKGRPPGKASGRSGSTNRSGSRPNSEKNSGSTGPKKVALGPEVKKRLPQRVVSTYEAGWSVVPQNFAKQPIVKWGKYQHEQPTPDELYQWARRRDVVTWGLVTGQASGICVLDFDQKHGGMETFERLGLQATLATPGGGRHVYVKAPDWRVRTLAQPGPEGYPGMELKADGSLCTFYSRDPNHPYVPLAGRRKYRVEDLPSGLAALFAPHRKGDNRKPGDVAALAERPLPSALQLALERLEGVRETDEGRQWEALCPAHDETEPSFGIGLGNDRLIVVNCFSCSATVDDVAAALEIDASEFSRKAWDSTWKEDAAYMLGSDTPLEQVRWLWRHVIPVAKATIFEGDPSKGKSTVTMDIAARVTTGRPMPDGPDDLGGPYAVLIISGEDDYADTIKPRLLAAGVDEERIIRLALERDDKGNVVPLTLPSGLTRIRTALRQAHDAKGLVAKLIIIDPITNFLAERTQSNVDASVRQALAPLAELASELDVALILVRHLNKQGEMKAMYRGGGSIAFVALSRSAYVFDQHPQDRTLFVMAPVKANLVARHLWKARSYRLESNEAYGVPKVEWAEGLLDFDADALLKGHDARKDAPETNRAKHLILELLEKGPQPADEMEKERKTAGISAYAWKAAKGALGVVSERKPYESGPRKGKTEAWAWRLPMEEGSNVVHVEAWMQSPTSNDP